MRCVRSGAMLALYLRFVQTLAAGEGIRLGDRENFDPLSLVMDVLNQLLAGSTGEAKEAATGMEGAAGAKSNVDAASEAGSAAVDAAAAAQEEAAKRLTDLVQKMTAEATQTLADRVGNATAEIAALAGAVQDLETKTDVIAELKERNIAENEEKVLEHPLGRLEFSVLYPPPEDARGTSKLSSPEERKALAAQAAKEALEESRDDDVQLAMANVNLLKVPVIRIWQDDPLDLSDVELLSKRMSRDIVDASQSSSSQRFQVDAQLSLPDQIARVSEALAREKERKAYFMADKLTVQNLLRQRGQTGLVDELLAESQKLIAVASAER